MTRANCGGIILTSGNTDDRKPVFELLKAVFGKVFADRGYVSQALFEQLLHTCCTLVASSCMPSPNATYYSLDAADGQAGGSQTRHY